MSYIKLVLAVVISSVCVFNVQGQDLELDITTGTHMSKINFHHDYPVKSDYDDTYEWWYNSNFSLGVTARIKNAWHLRTEIGTIKTSSLFFSSYTYNEGAGETEFIGWKRLNNVKAYIGIIPEYRKDYSSSSLKLFAGPVFAADIYNSNYNYILRNPKGVKTGAGFIYRYKNFGGVFNLAYVYLSSSVLENEHHPKISYSQVHASLGVVYSLSSKTD